MIQTGAEYHWKTSYDRHRMNGHYLDWENQPDPFKKYTDIQAIPLDPVSRLPEKSLWDLTYNWYYDFNDEKVSRLIGLDDRREAGLVCADIPGNPYTAPKKIPAVDPLPPDVMAAGRVSRREVVYDEIFEACRAGIGKPVSGRVEKPVENDIGITPAHWFFVEKTDGDDEERSYAESVLHRRSRRNHIPQPLPKRKFMRLLDLVCRSLRHSGDDVRYNCLAVGFLTGNIDGFEPGFYLLDPEKRRVGEVRTGHFLEPMAAVCLNQKWLTNAAIHFLFMANLQALDRNYGARGYRYTMLNAGRLGQLIYLGATAVGLGCCGIGALYDSEAQDLLGLNKDSALLYLVAAGPIQRRHSNLEL